MRADLNCEGLFGVLLREDKMYFYYVDGRVVTFLFETEEEADNFYDTHDFIEGSPNWKKFISGIYLKAARIETIGMMKR